MKDDEGEPYKMSSDSELLIFHKNYFNSSDFGGLHPPSDSFFEVCALHIHTFALFFANRAEEYNIKSKIVELCVQATNADPKHCDWFSGDCMEHRKVALHFLILVLLRKNCQWKVRKFLVSDVPTNKPEKIKLSNTRLHNLKN